VHGECVTIRFYNEWVSSVLWVVIVSCRRECERLVIGFLFVLMIGLFTIGLFSLVYFPLTRTWIGTICNCNAEK
jgi:hypothetical protein